MNISKEELKQELNRLEDSIDEKFASKDDLRQLENRIEEKLATKQDLVDVKEELIRAMTSIATDLKRHFDFTAERIRSDKDDAVEIQLADHGLPLPGKVNRIDFPPEDIT